MLTGNSKLIPIEQRRSGKELTKFKKYNRDLLSKYPYNVYAAFFPICIKIAGVLDCKFCEKTNNLYVYIDTASDAYYVAGSISVIVYEKVLKLEDNKLNNIYIIIKKYNNETVNLILNSQNIISYMRNEIGVKEFAQRCKFF